MSRAKRFYIIISILFIANSLLFLGLVSGAYLYLLNMSSGVSEKDYYRKMLSEKEVILAELEKRFEDIKDDITLINSTLPEEKEASKLISDLNALSRKSGLVFVSVKADVIDSKKKSSDQSLLQTEKGKYGYEMPLSVEVKGPYGNFVAFMKSIENYQRLINVTSVDIKHSSNGATSDEVQATLKLTVYLKR